MVVFQFEMQRYREAGESVWANGWASPEDCTGWVHMGFHHWLFDSRQAARDWYSATYPDMRALDEHDCSDWDPTNNNLRFVLRVVLRGEGIHADACRCALCVRMYKNGKKKTE